MDLSIVVPVYNSTDSLFVLCSEIEKFISGYETQINVKMQYEIIFVDDGSLEKTQNALKQIQTMYAERVKVIHLKKNRGQQMALYRGLLACSGAYALTMDDDLQHDIQSLAHFYEAAQRGSDLIFGIYESYGEKKSREWGSKIIGTFFKLRYKQLCGKRVSSLRLIHRSVYSKLPREIQKFVYLSAELIPHSQQIDNIHVQRRNRPFGKSGYTLMKCLKIGLQLTVYYGFFHKKRIKKPYTEETL